MITFKFRDVGAPSPATVKQLAATLTALAFPFGEGGPLAVEEVCCKIKITLVLRDALFLKMQAFLRVL